MHAAIDVSKQPLVAKEAHVKPDSGVLGDAQSKIQPKDFSSLEDHEGFC